MAAEFRAPAPSEVTELARKWLAVERLVQDEYGAALTGDAASLALLQRVIDDDLVGDDGYALQCLGCVLGRIMVHAIPGLDWFAVKDDLGESLCLRYADTTLRVFPLTMIAKRAERGESIDILGLYEQTKTAILNAANQAD